MPVRRPPVGGADPTGPEAGFRTDIEGLRAIAVISVVAYHLELRGFSGGFVGVDVFFVISGFLITRRLLRGAVEDRTVHIRDFYAARARRILPMATVVIVATIGAAMIWQDRLQLLQSTGADARSAALFFSNLRFASQGTDYMAEADAPSLFLQFWSLSVEEQFYLLWPALLLALVAIAARRAGSIRTSVTVALGLIVGLSFWLSQRYSTTDPVTAFFLLQSRAWEIGIGALLAVAGLRARRLRHPLGTVAAFGGMAAIVVAVVGYDVSTVWPGRAAAVPVLGTALVIVAGMDSQPSLPSRILSTRPMQAVGRYSYSIYLWHWPLVILVAGGEKPDLAAVIVIVSATLVLAVTSFYVVERPALRSTWLRARPSATLGLGFALLVVSVAASHLPGLTDVPLDAGRPYTGPTHVAGAPPLPTDFVPSNLTPTLAEGTSSFDAYAERNVDCDQLGECSYGDPAADVRIVLFGDSQAGQWTAAFAALATANDWHVDRVTRSGCSSLTVAAADGRCGGWAADRWQDIEQIDPDLLVLGGPDGAGFRAGPEVWEAKARHTLEDVVPSGIPVAVLSAFPPASLNVPSCLSEHLYDVSPCEPKWPSTRARTVEINERLRSVAGELGASVVELVPLLCLPDRCPVIVENVLVFRDAYHVTSAFAASRAGDLGDRLRRAID